MTLRYLLDTNALSDMVRNPHGKVAQRAGLAGRAGVCTSVVVAGELRYGAAKRGSKGLTQQLETILGALDVLALEPPADRIYGELRAKLEAAGTPISGNDLLIAAHALALDCSLVTANEREFSRVTGLRVENWLR